MKYRIEVKTKDEFRDTRGEKSLSEIKEIGISGIRQVKYSAIYLIEAQEPLDKNQAEKIAGELLADAVSEEFFVQTPAADAVGADGNPPAPTQIRAVGANSVRPQTPSIEVWHKKGAADPSAESIIKAIRDLKTQSSVKTAHKYYLHGQVSQKDLEKIAVKLFANTLIQDYKIEYPIL
jgi:phosphoribosylformylglycinamidine (FGAM) synthase PurS component